MSMEKIDVKSTVGPRYLPIFFIFDVCNWQTFFLEHILKFKGIFGGYFIPKFSCFFFSKCTNNEGKLFRIGSSKIGSKQIIRYIIFRPFQS